MLLNKLPADVNIGIDCNPEVIRFWPGPDRCCRLICGRAESFLKSWKFDGDELIYADPPYFPPTRRQKKVYRFDYTPDDHRHLLGILKALPCMVMISGYPHEFYDSFLDGWNKHSFVGTSHVGNRTECVWTNFSPAPLHDTRFLGQNFRERQTIKRKRERWCSRFGREPDHVRAAILSDLANLHARTQRSC